MERISGDSAVKLRDYQIEMFDASVKSNVVVAMDTGSGKTQVAIARIRRELEGPNSSKLIWFLAPKVALSEQQCKALKENLPGYNIISLTGLDNVDKWTDQKLWDATLQNVSVVVGTPAVLLDALTHGFIKISSLSLLVFDEAHHAKKAHPYNAILKLCHAAREQQQPVPAVLGLTASPVVNSKEGSLETLEANLNARAITPKQHREELKTYVRVPDVVTVQYSTDRPAAPNDVCSALAKEARTYDLKSDPYVVSLQGRDDPRSIKELETTLCKRSTYCSEQLKALDLRADKLDEELGRSMANWYVSRCIDRFRQGLASGENVLPDLSEQERSHLAGIFERVPALETLAYGETLSMTDKAQRLVDVLHDFAHPSLRGIIFVQQRVQVTALAEFLGRFPEIQRAYGIASFVGTSTSTKRKVTVADLVNVKDQQKDLDAFRSGEKNLMICTDVLEEGIDISACNLVVCFELPKNLVSFVQRRGRARRSGSKYVLFVSKDDMKQQNRPWDTLEAKMKEMYMDDTRRLKEVDVVHISDKTYRIDATGAVLTLENAKAHLYHFCSVGTIHASNYIDLRPEFDPVQDPVSKLWTATVDLPSFTHSSVRHATSSQAWELEELAIKDAAFEAYVALHKNGLINDNLLPLTKDYAPETGQHLDQPSIVSVSDRKASALWQSAAVPENAWHSTDIRISLADETIVEMVMWTPSVPPNLRQFELYWNRDLTYTITFHTSTRAAIEQDAAYIDMLRASTKLLLRSVHAARMPTDACDFPVLFAPADVDDLDKWLEEVQGKQTASELFERSGGKFDDAGLVQINGQAGRTFFIETVKEESSELAVRSFPKRKDFLHPIAADSSASAAYTSTQLFPLCDCAIDLLPAKYALFAAFVPSITHQVDTAVLAEELNTTILRDVGISDRMLVLEAISAPAAGEANDYNRLEYLGDTCLKHCVELQVMAQHSTWPESYLTVERDRMVRNTNLAKAAMDLGLDKYILTKPFTGSKWRPTYVSEFHSSEPKQRQMSTKTLADVVEALIGASFVDGGLEKAFLCIRTLLPTETWHLPEKCFDILIGELRPTEITNLALVERLIGHKFEHPTLLVESLTHVSFPYNRTGLSLERCEFLGDSVLDMLVTPKLFAHSRTLRHDQLHGLHEALVNAAFLGHLCMAYEGEEEILSVVAAGDTHEIKQGSRKYHLYDFLRCGAQLVPLRQHSLEMFHGLRQEIDEALARSGEYPWPTLVAERPQKFFCDLVESILGALFIDTRGDLSVCEAFAARLGIFKHMDRLLNDHVDTLSPKERVGILADQKQVIYVNSRCEKEGGKRLFTCTVTVGEEEIATVVGCGSKEEAEVKAAYKTCGILKARGPCRKRKVNVAGLESEEMPA